MLTNRTLARINNRPRTIGRLTLLAVGGGTLILSALLYAFGILPPFTVLAVLGGVLLVLLYVTQKAKTIISLSYKGKLDDETTSCFSEVQEALEVLASSEGIWRLPVH